MVTYQSSFFEPVVVFPSAVVRRPVALMTRKLNLVQLQEKAVWAILASREQGPRAASFGHAFLNRNPRVMRGIRKRFEYFARRLGYSELQVTAQWQDVKEMAILEAASEPPITW